MLTQAEADTLIAMRKTFTDPETITMPPGADKTYELIGSDEKEKFLLDLWRGTIRLSKLKFQTRGRKVIVLVRLDIDGSPHTNPDGNRLGGTHIHLYREGFEDKWAVPINPKDFRDITNLTRVFSDFCAVCNIADAPPVQHSML